MQAESALADAFARYEAAFASGQHDELVVARVSLIARLQATGWQPPPEVLDQMWRDRRTLRELERARVAEAPDVVWLPSHRPADSRRRLSAS